MTIRIKQHLEQAFASLAFVTAIIGIQFAVVGVSNATYEIFFYYIALFLIHYIIHWPNDESGSMLDVLLRSILFIPKNLFLLFFGNITGLSKLNDISNNTSLIPSAHDMLAEIQTATRSLHQTELFAEVAGIKELRPKKYYIVYTHLKKQEEEHRFVDIGGYKITGFPVDETETIMRIWQFVVNYLNLDWNDCRLTCSCNDVLQGAELEKAVHSSLAIIGSVKGNNMSQLLMDNIDNLHKQLKRTIFPYLMRVKNDETSGDVLCYLHSQANFDEDKFPTPLNREQSKRPKSDDVLVDYALIAKLPNILSTDDNNNVVVDKTNSVLFLAGCKVAGQIGAMKRLFDSAYLLKMSEEYKHEYYYEVLEVKWNYIDGGLPRILSCEELYSSSISF